MFSKILRLCQPSSKQSKQTHGTDILFPLYIYPDPACWDPLFAVIDAHPSQRFTIIVNPNSGPGEPSYPDEEYKAGLKKLNSYKNVTTIGYVYSSYGKRPLPEVLNDIKIYAAWSKFAAADISVKGIMVDEVASDKSPQNIKYIKSIHSLTKRLFSNNGMLVINPGTVVDTQFYGVADVVISFEDATEAFTTLPICAGYKSQAVLMHSFHGSTRKQEELIRDFVKRGVGYLFITTTNPTKGEGDYNQFSKYLHEFVDATEKANIDQYVD